MRGENDRMTMSTLQNARESHTVNAPDRTRSRWGILMLVGALLLAGFGPAARPVSAMQPDGASKQKSNDENGKVTAREDGAKKKEAKGRKLKNPFPKRFKAPSLDGGESWLNASGEITLKDLRGKVVLLDFWTFCCINCMHVLPDLKYLEKKYRNELVVIGVHSAKFNNEKDAENIRKAILRYEIEHPVINDAKMNLWRKFGARSWPTLVVIDPEGYYCGFISGEGHREVLDLVLKKVIAYHKQKGTLDTTPIRFDLERHNQKPTPLKFPGKVLADEKNKRLFIADTNHNRIVISSLSGELQAIIGTGEIGRKDGSFDEAQFDHPQGMTLVGQRLYVADTENHLIRRIDLAKKTVTTLAGTGKQARRRYKSGRLKGIPLNSPWALTHVDGTLYICMAGPHQIWQHKIGSDRISVFSGSGREDVTNGTHLMSAFAQPSGIVSDGKFLYVADSEGSAIRQVPISPAGKVTTLVGTSDLPLGRSLFEFGDKDGIGADARLQHPLGIALHGKRLYIADSYNHKIKVIESTASGAKVTTWLGNGQRGKKLNPAQFSEPAGVSIADGKLYIADTNNHRICVADLKTGEVTELTITGLKPPKKPATEVVQAGNSTNDDVRKVQTQVVKSDEKLTVTVKLKLPADYKLNPNFPHRYRLTAQEKPAFLSEKQITGRPKPDEKAETLTFEVPIGKAEGKATLTLAVTFGYCREGKGGLCRLKTARWSLPIEAAANAQKSEITIQADASLPKAPDDGEQIKPLSKGDSE